MGDIYTNPPQSRNEAILRATIDGTEYTAPPQSRIEDLLLELKEAIEQGGTGEGDMKKSVYDSDSSIASAGGIKMFVNQKIGTLPQRVGSLETTAGVLEGEVASIEDTLDNLGTASTKNAISVVTDSSDLVESGAVKDIVGWGNKNLCRGLETGSINQSTGQDQTGTNKRTIGIVSIKKGSTVTISGFNSDETPQYRIFYYSGGVYQNDEVLSYSNDTLSGTVTVGSTIDGIRCQITPSKVDDTKFMVEYGSVATTYEPYHESVSDSLNDVQKAIEYNSKLGAYNILNNTASSQTIFTVDKDKVVTVNTSGVSNLAKLTLQTDISNLVGLGKLHISGCPQGGSDTKYEIAIWNSSQQSLLNTETNQRVREYGNGYDVDLTRCTNPDGTAVNFTTCTIEVVIRSGAGELNNLKFYPMITLESNKGLSYQPPTQTNRELTVNKCDTSVIGTVEDGTNPTKAYVVGEHMIRNGKFCTVTVAVTTSSTWTLGNNYVEGDVASEFSAIDNKILPMNTKNITTSTSAEFTLENASVYMLAIATDYISGNGKQYASIIFTASDGTISEYKLAEQSLTGLTVDISVNNKITISCTSSTFNAALIKLVTR